MAQKDKIVNIEILRCIAAIGIIWFHTENAKASQIGYSGLPIFMMIFIAISTAYFRKESFNHYIKKKFNRLILPWLFWSFAYLFLKVTNAIRSNEEIAPIFKYNVFLVGTNIHLWYLPFAFFCSILIFVLLNFFNSKNNLAVVAVSIFSGMALLFASSFALNKISLDVPFPQWLFILPAFPLGLAIGKASQVKKHHAKFLTTILICISTFTTCAFLYLIKLNDLVMPYSIAIFLTTLAYLLPDSSKPLWIKLGSLTYGIYLIHPAIISILTNIFHVYGPVIQILLTGIISLTVIWLLSKTRIKIFI